MKFPVSYPAKMLSPARQRVYTALAWDAKMEALDDVPMKRARFPFRYLLYIPAIGSLIDAITHRYTWPGKYQPMNPRLIMVLGTHSREGRDAWIMLLCFLAIGLLDRWEAAKKDLEK